MSLCSFVSVYSGEIIAGKAKGEIDTLFQRSLCVSSLLGEVSEDQFVPFVAVKRESRVLFGRSKPLRWRGGGWRTQAQKSAPGDFVSVVAEWCCRGYLGTLFVSQGLALMLFTYCND